MRIRIKVKGRIRIPICIKVTSRIRTRIKVKGKNRIRIRVRVMLIRTLSNTEQCTARALNTIVPYLSILAPRDKSHKTLNICHRPTKIENLTDSLKLKIQLRNISENLQLLAFFCVYSPASIMKKYMSPITIKCDMEDTSNSWRDGKQAFLQLTACHHQSKLSLLNNQLDTIVTIPHHYDTSIPMYPTNPYSIT